MFFETPERHQKEHDRHIEEMFDAAVQTTPVILGKRDWSKVFEKFIKSRDEYWRW